MVPLGVFLDGLFVHVTPAVRTGVEGEAGVLVATVIECDN